MGDIDLGGYLRLFLRGAASAVGAGWPAQTAPMKGDEPAGVSLPSALRRRPSAVRRRSTSTEPNPATTATATGCAPGTTAEVCPDCHGSGQIRIQRGGGAFTFATTTTCPKCRRQGQDHPSALQELRRRGQRPPSAQAHRLPSPPASTTARRSPSGGRAARAKTAARRAICSSASPSSPHEFFKRDGTSVYLEHPVTFLQATLGAELEIPTIDGKVKWSLPAGTQPGTTFRLRGKGIPERQRPGPGRPVRHRRTSQVPTGLTHEQKEALRAYGEAMGELSPGPMEGVKSFFDKKKKKK